MSSESMGLRGFKRFWKHDHWDICISKRPKTLKKPGPEAPKSEKPLGKVPEISAGAKRLKFWFKIYREEINHKIHF